ncbi:ATP-grasp domain-containing protein [Pseudomonas amygdali]|uniref:ATP-grasp domain-containing protein n=2 Tax=Pseudomonas amygdali pv. lachrymans TaxID=53707 RepID=A0ABR5KRZ6_PSEAV|nr:ATP-grasp domain-containing protein [Pseudomonas amygdali]AXH60081.1 hypothetical protein PLA107_033185 [Pseudomonas amygdali pv. lachrymans str. M301315]KPC17486.1 Uncharacterized protein AC499_0688 [Pseudomonas amygdali pv. lachrymans]RMT05667.1 hypothetical protein ALP54_03929 [Pseudomonas amygdali pv. lachrymans]
MSNTPLEIGSLEIAMPDFTPDPNFKTRAYEDAKSNKNAFASWFHAVEGSGVNYPATLSYPLSINLQTSMMGEPIEEDPSPEVDALVAAIQKFGNEHGFPLFIKTSFTSNKHDWAETCHLANGNRDTVMRQVYNLWEFQAMCSPHLFTPELIVRKMIEVEPVFEAFMGMPVTEEFRLFARDGKLEAYQPYWPVSAIRNPSVEDWEARLATIKTPKKEDLQYMTKHAEAISKNLGGYWSVDFLRGKDGKLWLIDMAEGDRSYVNTVDLVKIKAENDLEP